MEHIQLKTPRQIDALRSVGHCVAHVLDCVSECVRPGISTLDLDRVALETSRKIGVKPAFLGYQGFPASLCVSINNEVTHGIPSENRILMDGDIVSIDFGASYRGWFSDSARTIGVGSVSREAQGLLGVTREALARGIVRAVPENRVFDIGYAIQNYVEDLGFSVVRDFVGHGIGRSLHEDPQVPNYGPCGKGILLRSGMILAIEPMVNVGSYQVKILGDGWTVVTADYSLSAHFEHTIAITDNGPEILTMA